MLLCDTVGSVDHMQLPQLLHNTETVSPLTACTTLFSQPKSHHKQMQSCHHFHSAQWLCVM